MSTILASASPRRRELLEMLGVPDLIIHPAQGEELVPEHAAPGEIVKALSRVKAEEVAAQHAPGDLVIAADTIVWIHSAVFGKPHSEEEAYAMLSALSGNTHEVYTGVTVLQNGKCVSEYECTRVTFRKLSDRQIRSYIASGEPMDKAGAYGAQGKGALLVEKIDGDFFNVMGLPLCRLDQMLSAFGAELLGSSTSREGNE